METNRFEEPVTVVTGLGVPREISTAFEAYTFLAERHSARWSAEHQIARRACLAAIEGRVDAETARGAFVAYAKRVGLLVPDMADVIAARGNASAGQASV